MKIWHSTGVGGPETLRMVEAPTPTPAAHEVLVDVAACGINFPDSLIIQDLYQVKPERPFAPGGEIAGTVVATGAAVTEFLPGDRVMARSGWGGLATQLAIAAGLCVRVPDSMPFAEAAALPFAYGTSYHALTQRAPVKAGDRVLVLGASGGTGTSAVEIAKAAGAFVVAGVSSEDKAAFARECGADATVIYPRGSLDRDQAKALTQAFKAALGGDGADVVFDPVGGDYAEPALRAIAWRGRYLIVGFPAGIPRLPFNLPLLKGCEIVGVFNGGFHAREPDLAKANLRALIALYEAGKIRPRVSGHFAFEDAPAAIEQVAGRRALGKLVVQMA